MSTHTPSKWAKEKAEEAYLGPNRCHANRDGDCYWTKCPQIRDGEPMKSGRHCPLDNPEEEEEECPRLQAPTARRFRRARGTRVACSPGSHRGATTKRDCKRLPPEGAAIAAGEEVKRG